MPSWGKLLVGVGLCVSTLGLALAVAPSHPSARTIPALSIEREPPDPSAGAAELAAASQAEWDAARHRLAMALAEREQRARTARARARSGGCSLDYIKRAESGNNYGAVSRTGKYRGAHQFDAPTWRGAVTRAGYPEYANTPVNEVPPSVQDAAAAQLYAERGSQPWSVCR